MQIRSLLLLLFIIMAACTSASAQRTRDQLFPSFQKDITVVQKKDATPDLRPTATSTRSLIFTNYQQSRSSGNNSSRMSQVQAAPAAQQLPSALSAAAAAKKATPVPTSVKAPILQQ